MPTIAASCGEGKAQEHPQAVQWRYQREILGLKPLDASPVVVEEQSEIAVNVVMHRMVAIQEPASAERAVVNVVADKMTAGKVKTIKMVKMKTMVVSLEEEPASMLASV